MAILGHLVIHIKFGICFLKFIYNLVGNMGITLDLFIYLEKIDIFTMSSFPTYEYMIFLHLFTTSLLYVYHYSFMHKIVVDCTIYQDIYQGFYHPTWSSTIWPCYSPPTGRVSFPSLWIWAEAEVMPLDLWG